MERSISISELSAENGVAVVNAYGSIIRDNEDRVDDSTTEVCWYLYVTTVENSTSQIEKCHLKRIEKFETHEECDCIRQASEAFIKRKTQLTS